MATSFLFYLVTNAVVRCCADACNSSGYSSAETMAIAGGTNVESPKFFDHVIDGAEAEGEGEKEALPAAPACGGADGLCSCDEKNTKAECA